MSKPNITLIVLSDFLFVCKKIHRKKSVLSTEKNEARNCSKTETQTNVADKGAFVEFN